MPNPAADDDSRYGRLQDGLLDLLRDLRKHGFRVGVDQYLAAQRLLLAWQPQPPLAPEVIRASLGALFSTSADEQQRFPELFKIWYLRCNPEITSFIEPEVSKPPKWVQPIKLDKKTLTAIMLWLILAALVLFRVLEYTNPRITTPILDQGISNPVTDKPKPEPRPPLQAKLPAPHTPPEPIVVPEQYYFTHIAELKTLFALPVLLWLGWFLYRIQLRYLTLSKRRGKRDEKINLQSLRFNTGKADLFPTQAMKPVWHAWRRFLPFRSHRLHTARTVKTTLDNGGFFLAKFRSRLLPPEYVLIIDRRHYHDYCARLGGEFKQRMQAEGLFVNHYQYDTNPNYCWSQARTDRFFSLPQLANRHQGQPLIIIGEARSFYQAVADKPIAFGSDGSWLNKTLLTLNTPEDWAAPEHCLMQHGFRISPFSRRGINELLTLSKTQPKQRDLQQARSLDYRDSPLPDLFQAGIWPWLDERKPDKPKQRQSIAALKAYLGLEGFCLLAAVAAYPALDWQLTLALDIQLGLEADEFREIRLRKLARLPWFRHGNLPDVWRILLINSLSPELLKKIYAAYQALLNTDNTGQGLIDLPVAVPDLTNAVKDQSEWINTAGRGDPLQDHVFASVIRGRKPSLHEFTLPYPIKNWLPPHYWRGLFARALLGLVIASGASVGAYLAWQQWGQQLLEHETNQRMHDQMAAYKIQIRYADPELKTYADNLQTVLSNWGFKDVDIQPDVGFANQTLKSGQLSNAANTIDYPKQTPPELVQLLKQRLSYLSYGAAVTETKSAQTSDNTLVIRLNQAYQEKAVFRDFINLQNAKNVTNANP